jgi:hypothetical protein
MALVNRKVGDEVEFELHGSKRRHRLEKIDVWKVEATPHSGPETVAPTPAA